MTIEEAVAQATQLTTDRSGHLASYVFRRGKTIGYVEARLDKSAGKSPALWQVLWTVHTRSDDGQEYRDTSTDPVSMLSRFGPIDLNRTTAKSLDEVK
jgi:hypothetical protein